MKLLVKCTICHEAKTVNGQTQFDTWKVEHKHLDKQTELNWKLGNQFEIVNQ